MVKVKISLVVALLVVAIVSIYFGDKHLKASQIEQAASDKQLNTKFEENNQKRIAASKAEIDKLKPNGSPRSFLDDVRYIKALKGVVNISTLGSSVTQGTGASDVSKKWSTQLSLYLRDLDKFTNINLTNNGFGGYTAGMILSENKVDEVIAQKPDIVLFETSILNDHGLNVPVEQTIKNISDVVSKIKSGLPDAKIILLSPNPKADDKKNPIGLTMTDYATKTKELALSKGWSFIDIYGGFISSKADMKLLTIPDGIHPNDDGYKMWFDIMKSEFEKIQ